MTMLMSIAHRITGIALYVGMAPLALWLIAAATDAALFDEVQALIGSWPGQAGLILFTFALMHHLLGGIRHAMWDFGIGMGDAARRRLAWATLIGSIAATAAIWAAVAALRQGGAS